VVHGVMTWSHLPALVAVGAALLAGYLGFRRSTTTGEVGARLSSSLVPRILGSLSDDSLRSDGTLDLPERFERMGAVEFEAEISCLLRALGYTVRPTPPSSIHDIDLILEMAGRRVAVQLKRWKAPVGDRSVYGLFAGRIHHATHEAWLITTSRFTSRAVKLASTTGVRLVDGAELAGWLEASGSAGVERRS
jgi:restriction endonuclease